MPIETTAPTFAGTARAKYVKQPLKPGQTLDRLTGIWPEVGGDGVERLRFKHDEKGRSYVIMFTGDEANPNQPEYTAYARTIVPNEGNNGTNAAVLQRIAGCFPRMSKEADPVSGQPRISMQFVDPVTKERFVLFYNGHLEKKSDNPPLWSVSRDITYNGNQAKIHKPYCLGGTGSAAPAQAQTQAQNQAQAPTKHDVPETITDEELAKLGSELIPY